ncbi:MAG TPA: hypothetical protein VNQ56_14140 [Pseudolabrys sp.]|nr:hypothetical protein [Pseudolabrys sp.]
MLNFASSLAACFAIVLALEYANPAGATLIDRDAVAPQAVQQVNRAGKSDRLPGSQLQDGSLKKETINVPTRVLVGCDAAFSSLASDARGNFATHCLS